MVQGGDWPRTERRRRRGRWRCRGCALVALEVHSAARGGQGASASNYADGRERGRGKRGRWRCSTRGEAPAVVGVDEDMVEWRENLQPSLVKMSTARASVERERAGRGEGVRVERVDFWTVGGSGAARSRGRGGELGWPSWP
jgi:hypothetical protein